MERIKYAERINITSVTQISLLTLISHTPGKFELNIYHSNKMTERPVEYTLHNIWSPIYVQSRLSKLEILHLTRLPYFVWTVFSLFCVSVPFRAASLGLYIYMQPIACVMMYQTLTDCIIWCTTASREQYFKLR